MVAHACHRSTLETEAGGWKVGSQMGYKTKTTTKVGGVRESRVSQRASFPHTKGRPWLKMSCALSSSRHSAVWTYTNLQPPSASEKGAVQTEDKKGLTQVTIWVLSPGTGTKGPVHPLFDKEAIKAPKVDSRHP